MSWTFAEILVALIKSLFISNLLPNDCNWMFIRFVSIYKKVMINLLIINKKISMENYYAILNWKSFNIQLILNYKEMFRFFYDLLCFALEISLQTLINAVTNIYYKRHIVALHKWCNLWLFNSCFINSKLL